MRDVVRNVGLFGHNGAGKTSLADALLFELGGCERLGRVLDGTSHFDSDPQAQRRHVTVQCACHRVETEGGVCNIIDSPGMYDFRGEAVVAAALTDIAVVAVDALSGVQVGTEWAVKTFRGRPLIFVVTKLDRESSSFAKAFAELQKAFGGACLPLYVPDGDSEDFRRLDDACADGAFAERLAEAAAEQDDGLLERYLEGGTLSPDEVHVALAKAIAAGALLPVLPVSVEKGLGIRELATTIRALTPARPIQQGVRCRVVKTVADPYVGKLSWLQVISGTLTADCHLRSERDQHDERIGALLALKGREHMPLARVLAGDVVAIAKMTDVRAGDVLVGDGSAAGETTPVSPLAFPDPEHRLSVRASAEADEDKLGTALARMLEEDPTLRLTRNDETHEWVIWGLGDLHLEVLQEKLRSKFAVAVTFAQPKVAYRETLRKPVRVEGKYKKQSGGRGQFGHVWLELEPLADGDFAFIDKVFGGSVPGQYRPAVEKGVREAMAEGVLAGYPVVGVAATLVDGSSHPVDSSEMAFKIAAAMAFRKGALQAAPVLLEPLLAVTVLCRQDLLGDVISEVTRLRGKVIGMENAGGEVRLLAHIPEAETFRLPTLLRALSGGRARVQFAFDHYEEVPVALARELAEVARAR